MEFENHQRAYDEWHDHRRSITHRDPLEFPWYRSVFREIIGSDAGRILEVGCGRGEFALFLADNFPTAEIVGLDFSKMAIDAARTAAVELGKRVEFVCGNAEELPFPGGSFDLVISCECMEHVVNPPAMARELARVTRAGGQICLTTENYFNGMLLARLHSQLTGRPFDSGSGVQPRENLMFFWNVKRWLEDADLQIERTESCHYQWLLLPRVDPARLRTDQFSRKWARRLAKPFGRHFSFFARKRTA